MLTDWLSKLIANSLENNIVLIVVSITHQLKSTVFDRFQLVVNNFFHVFEIKTFRSINAVLNAYAIICGDFSHCYPLFVICDIIIQALRNYCITRGQMYLE